MPVDQMLPDLSDVTSLEGSAAGSLPCNLPIGQVTGKCGPEAAPANRSAIPVSDWDLATSGICGQNSIDSLSSDALQRSLESRLQAALDTNGSPEFTLTWSWQDIGWHRRNCALRASARRTSDKDCGGWPTPTSPTKTDGHQAGNNRFVTKATELVGWGTPTSRDWKDQEYCCNVDTGSLLGRQAWLSNAQMEKAGALNPEHCRWLMGFPVEWTKFADTATP